LRKERDIREEKGERKNPKRISTSRIDVRREGEGDTLAKLAEMLAKRVRVQSTWKHTQTIEYDFNYELILFARAEERRHIGKELLEISSEIKKIKGREKERKGGRNTL
jgi:hypothetical protein